MAEKWITLEVSTKRTYIFKEHEINGWSPQKIAKDWFTDTPISHHHATRDAHELGNSEKVTKIVVKRGLPK